MPIKLEKASTLASRFPGVTLKDHFGGDGYSANGRQFITIWPGQNCANLRLSKKDQQKYLELDGEIFSEINNAWGRQGWTRVHFEFVDEALFIEALKAAYEQSKTATKAAPKSAAKKQRTKKKRTKKNSVRSTDFL